MTKDVDTGIEMIDITAIEITSNFEEMSTMTEDTNQTDATKAMKGKDFAKIDIVMGDRNGIEGVDNTRNYHHGINLVSTSYIISRRSVSVPFKQLYFSPLAPFKHETPLPFPSS